VLPFGADIRSRGGAVNPERLKLAIDCDELATQELRSVFGAADQAQFIERRNLSGDAATWIVVATLTMQGLPHLLEFLIKWRELGRVKRIKINDIEIDNPSPEDLVRFRAQIAAGLDDSDGTR